MTKIDIISGFLGAGKTTFIKKMIDEVFKGEKIVLIEPSGVGKLSDVMKSVIDIEKEEDVKLNGLVTVVNALKASKQMKAFGEFFNNQIEYATVVVLSRSQNATPEQLELCVKQIQSLNPKAAIITTAWDAIKGEQILKVIEGADSLEMKLMAEQHAKEEAAEHEHEHHHHDHDHDHEDHEHEHEHEHEHHHDHDHEHEHSHVPHEHHHHHEHRGLQEVIAIIDATDMSAAAKELALKIFDIIADAEATAHAVEKNAVHFHEVGAIDSIVDIVAIAVCADSLGVENVIVPELCEGRGTVRCQHGVLPVPVPATANIMQRFGFNVRLLPMQGEFVTPTGAAAAAALMTTDELPQSFKILGIGLGAGKRQYERPSILRVLLIEDNAQKKTL